jgi:uncharacterized membrane protein
MQFEDAIKLIGKVIDGCGVGVIVLGTLVVSVTYVLRFKDDSEGAYRQYRQGLGRSILLGLELLVAADIIRTVAVDPTFMSAGVLAIIVAIRTFLSWSLGVELHGRWPWQRDLAEASVKAQAGRDRGPRVP